MPVTVLKMKVIYADGPQAPIVDPAGWRSDSPGRGSTIWFWDGPCNTSAWLSEVQGRTFMAGYALSAAIAAGNFVALPIRLGAVPSFVTAFAPDVAVIGGVRRGDGFAFSSSVGWGDVAASVAREVIVEVDPAGVDYGGPSILGNIVGTFERAGVDALPAIQRPADEIDLRIGELVASLLPAKPTLQFGPGGIGEGIARAVNRPVHIWSGLLTDAMAALASRGLLLGHAVAAYTWGGDPVQRLAAAGRVDLRSVTETHDLTRVAGIPRFIGCNTAIQVGLDGSINVERVGGRTISSVGGHADFCNGASRSVGGLSIIAARSTNTRGESTIVPQVEVVSTARTDVQVVVTEHGIADLRGLDDAQRATRIAAIAAPEHRPGLNHAF